jgi:hypothetical protein
MQKETLKATYTAAEASQSVREVMAELGEEAGEPELPAVDRFSSVSRWVTPQGDELLSEVRDQELEFQDGAEPEDEEGVAPPPGMMELRPGAPGELRAGLLFVVQPQDTALVLACVEDPGGSARRYRAAIQLAADRLAATTDGEEAADVPGDDAFTSYDAESFLDEFFPSAETEAEIAAGALVARSSAHSLAEARQRMRLTQAQMARRMNVRQERVSAIERGRLEIIAHVGGERIILR